MFCGQELLNIISSLEQIEAGTNDKIQVFTQVISQSEVCKKILLYATDPMLKFQMTSLPAPSSNKNEHCDWSSFFIILDALSKARGASHETKLAVADIVGPCFACRDIAIRILKKKLRIGLGVKNLNKCGLNISLPRAQLAEKDINKFNSKRSFYAGRKLNGIRIIFKRTGNDILFTSRKGHQFKVLTQIYDKRLSLLVEDEEYDGEFMSDRGKDDALSICRRDNPEEPIENILARTCINVFDNLSLGKEILDVRLKALQVHEDRIFCNMNLGQRRLIQLLPHEYYQTATNEEFNVLAMSLMDKYVLQKYEGLMLKNPYTPYINDRTYDWVKLKPFDYADLPVVDVVLGTEGLTEGVVSKLIVNFNGVEVGVGSGLDAKQRIDWVDPEKRPKIVEVKYQSVTMKNGKPYSLEFPILSDKNDNLTLVETRDDH